jgi:hypothetical protein
MANVERFLRAAFDGDLPRVQKMLADGDARITDADDHGRTALLCAAMKGSTSFPTLKWLLKEGGACITDRENGGYSAHLLAAHNGIVGGQNGNFTACQWLLEHGGADIADATNAGKTVWNMLPTLYNSIDLVTALLRVMMLKGDPPADFVAQLRPEHARVVVEGARLRAALPAYLVQRRALLDAHCPLIAPLLALVHGYDPEPTTTKELWATGLGAAPQRAGCPRPEATIALPVRRSARLRQRLE